MVEGAWEHGYPYLTLPSLGLSQVPHLSAKESCRARTNTRTGPTRQAERQTDGSMDG
jgi:hypothetical protein